MEAEDINLPNELKALSNLLDEQPEVLATGSNRLQSAALNATKYIYDLGLKSEAQSREHVAELLSSISPTLAPQTRSQSSKRKRSPSPAHDGPTLQETPLTELFVDGMSDDQIWAQLELRAKNVCSVLQYALDGGDDEDEEEPGEGVKNEDEDMEGIEMDSDEDGEVGSSEDLTENGDSEESEEDRDHEEESDGDDHDEGEDLGEDVIGLRDPSDEEDDDDDGVDLDRPSVLNGGKLKFKFKRKAGGHPELDDGFFDLAAFNAETEQAEARAVSKGQLSQDDSDDDEHGDEEVDLYAPIDDDATAFDEEDLEGGNEPFYKDFFDPPPRVAGPKGKGKVRADKNADPSPGKVRFHEEVRVKNIKAKGKNLPTSGLYEDDNEDDNGYEEDEYGEIVSDEGSEEGEEAVSEEEEEEDFDDESIGEDEGGGRETMERFKDDLFAEEQEAKPDLSAYEKRMVALREEIAALEAQNVAKKDWTLMGEATSRTRPQNSLLEEDLEFERVMKSVPVITEETVQSLEERIKSRILESQFDDVLRKRPLDDKPFLPSRLFELQDSKSKQSLAEIYEDEYTAAQTGGIAGEDRDGKLKNEHQEIEKLWELISGKLDALCNAHFTPKAPKASISTVANVAAATMESALPTALSSSSMLAPEEVFAPPSSSDLRARSELTPTEKRALRNKQKKAKKKAHDALENSVDKLANTKRIGGIKKQKEAAMKSVVKNGKGVTVIGKKNKDITTEKRKRIKT